MTAPHADIVESTIEANGLQFGLLSMGEGPLALCLHGFPDSAWTWQYLLPELAAAGYRAVAPFLRGYAPTSLDAEGKYQTGANAADAIALHEALGGDGDAVLIGHDVGAFAAYAAANAAPERWSKVVTLSIAPPNTMAKYFFTYDQLRRSWYVWLFQSPLAELAVPSNDFEFFDRIWADWSPGFDGTEFVDRAKAALGGSDNTAAALAWYRSTVGAGPRDPEFDAIEATAGNPLPQPALYLHGTTDGCFQIAEIDDEVLAALPAAGSHAELIDGVGHFLHLEDPVAINRRIIEFLAG